MSVLAVGSTMWLSGAMLGSTDSNGNAGYALVGGIEMWESVTLQGGDYEMTGHIEPAWSMVQPDDEQACDEVELSGSATGTGRFGQQEAGVGASTRRAAPDADAIIELVRMWGVCPTTSCGPDLTGDGLVETADLMKLLFSGERCLAAAIRDPQSPDR